ncbi:DUF6906 family protein [Solibacillus sp. FSL H8-0538]|uniref:DUF6906 family protein n=1 Tax=Solibacillus sp. FSL H8-0538 TaxID=2921400 RepID=UPI00404690B1
MKQGRKPSVNERNYIKSFRLNPSNWFISKKKSDEWLIMHRELGRTRTIPSP